MLHTNHVWAIVLVVRLALLTLQARPNLRTATDTVADLASCDLRSDLDGLAYDFVANADWESGFTPATSDGVNV